jgi:hypothetical protein
MTQQPVLRHKGAPNPVHVPDADDLRELCGLVTALRAWMRTPSDLYDHGSEHPLYPRHQPHNGYASVAPLWAAMDAVLERHGFGRPRL